MLFGLNRFEASDESELPILSGSSLSGRKMNGRLNESVPQFILDEALARIEAILFE